MKLLVIAVVALSTLGCNKKQSQVVIKVVAKTSQGEPVSEAAVQLDREVIGETNAFGTFTKTISVTQNSRHRIDVEKQNERYYFAPHFETVLIPKTDTSTWDVEAVLYMVPKPRASKAELNAEVQTPAPPLVEEVTATPAPSMNASDILAESPFIKEEEFFRVVDFNKTSEVSLGDNHAPTPLFTVHTYAGRDPVADTAVYGCVPGRVPELLCKSNERGRCVVRHATESVGLNSALIVKRSGMRTQVVEGPFDRNSNVRLSLNAGKTWDVVALLESAGAKKPARDVSLSIKGETRIIQTSLCGFASIALSQETASTRKLKLRANHKGITGGSQELDVTVRSNHEGFQDLILESSEIEQPRVVLQSPLPGDGLTAEDLERLFNVRSLEQWTTKVLQQAKAANQEMIAWSDFQQILKPNASSEMAVIPSKHERWSSDSNALAVATHRVELVLLRTGQNLECSLALFDADGKLTLSARQPVTSLDDAAMMTKSVLDSAKKVLSTKGYQPLSPAKPKDRWLAVVTEPAMIGIQLVDQVAVTKLGAFPLALARAEQVILKAPSGYLDMKVKVPLDMVWAASKEPLVFTKDLLVQAESLLKIGEGQKIATLLQETDVDHPQRRALELLVAYTAWSKEPQDLIPMKKMADEIVTAETNSAKRLNTAIAQAIVADADSETKEQRIVYAEKAIKSFEQLLERNETVDAEPKKMALYYRAHAKEIVAELKPEPLLALDAEADYKEFLKLIGDQNLQPRDRKFSSLALKHLDSLKQQ